MRQDTQIIGRMRRALEQVRAGNSGQVEELQALLLAAEAEAFLEDFATEKQHQLRRITMPEGYELTRSEGQWGYRLKGGDTLEWETTAYAARRNAWNHFDAYADKDRQADNEAIETGELTAGTPVNAQVHRVMIIIAMRMLEVSAYDDADAIIELPDLIEDIQLVGGNERKTAIVDHLVMLGFLEELPPDLVNRGPIRAFRWIGGATRTPRRRRARRSSSSS